MNKLIVKHQHRYSFEKKDIYEGDVEIKHLEDHDELFYQELDGSNVRVLAYDDHLEIKRKGELISNLYFAEEEKTVNLIESPFGDIEIELFTYSYKRFQDKLIVEYDILSSNEKDGYIIEFTYENKNLN